MKYILLFILTIISYSSICQKTRIEAKIIVISPNDTLYRTVIGRMHTFRDNEIDESMFTYGVTYLENGKKVGVSSSRIIAFEYHDSTRVLKNRKFINVRLVYKQIEKESRPIPKFSFLLEEIITGKISWYVMYDYNPFTYNITVRNLFIKDGELDKNNSKNLIKRLKKLISDQPKLIEEIDKTKFLRKPKLYQPQVLEFISQYNQL